MLQQQGFTCIEVDLNPPHEGKLVGTGEELMDHFVDRKSDILIQIAMFASLLDG